MMAEVRTGLWVFPDRPVGELLQAVLDSERQGLDEFWLGDEGPAREPFSVLAAASVVTDRIRLCSGVTNPYLRHPALTASTALTIHEFSGGRMVLGVGAGGDMSLQPFGFDAVNPVSRVRSFIEIARSVAQRRACDEYKPPSYAIDENIVGSRLTVFVGSRSEKINRLASEVADGVFVAGMPPFRFGEVIGWARSKRPIDVALYPGAAFSDEAIECNRPQMIWGLLNGPQAARDRLGVSAEELQQAADELRSGDDSRARSLITDRRLGELILVGSVEEIGCRLAALVQSHEPSSIGLALTQADLSEGIDCAVAAFQVMRRELGDN